jgi:Domain of unknown function (DUF4224)
MHCDDRPALFLTGEEMTVLTGRKMKGKQVEAMRTMGILFFVDAMGQPVVARSAINGGQPEPKLKEPWVPKVLRDKQ